MITYNSDKVTNSQNDIFKTCISYKLSYTYKLFLSLVSIGLHAVCNIVMVFLSVLLSVRSSAW